MYFKPLKDDSKFTIPRNESLQQDQQQEIQCGSRKKPVFVDVQFFCAYLLRNRGFEEYFFTLKNFDQGCPTQISWRALKYLAIP